MYNREIGLKCVFDRSYQIRLVYSMHHRWMDKVGYEILLMNASYHMWVHKCQSFLSDDKPYL